MTTSKKQCPVEAARAESRRYKKQYKKYYDSRGASPQHGGTECPVIDPDIFNSLLTHFDEQERKRKAEPVVEFYHDIKRQGTSDSTLYEWKPVSGSFRLGRYRRESEGE